MVGDGELHVWRLSGGRDVGIDTQRIPVGFRSGRRELPTQGERGRKAALIQSFCMSLLSPFPSVRKQCGSWGFTVGWGSRSVLSLRGWEPSGLCAFSLGSALPGTRGTLEAGPGLLEEPIHSPVSLDPLGDSDGDAVDSAVVRVRCALLPQSFVKIISHLVFCCFVVFFFPGAAGVTLQKSLPPQGGAFHSISIPIPVPCWGLLASQPCRPHLGQTEQVEMGKT